jgi:hypothetical protein
MNRPLPWRRFATIVTAVLLVLTGTITRAIPANADIAPELCPAGFFSATGFAPCTPAPLGHYVALEGAIIATPAPLGKYVDVEGAIAATPAPIGFYVDSIGAAFAIACPEGQTTSSLGSTSSDDCIPQPTSCSGGFVLTAMTHPADANGDGFVCVKEVLGKGNQKAGSNVKDNNTSV